MLRGSPVCAGLCVVGDGGGGDLATIRADGLACEGIACLANAAEEIVAARVRERLGDQVEPVVVKFLHSHTNMLEPFPYPFDSHRLESARGVCDGGCR